MHMHASRLAQLQQTAKEFTVRIAGSIEAKYVKQVAGSSDKYTDITLRLISQCRQ